MPKPKLRCWRGRARSMMNSFARCRSLRRRGCLTGTTSPPCRRLADVLAAQRPRLAARCAASSGSGVCQRMISGTRLSISAGFARSLAHSLGVLAAAPAGRRSSSCAWCRCRPRSAAVRLPRYSIGGLMFRVCRVECASIDTKSVLGRCVDALVPQPGEVGQHLAQLRQPGLLRFNQCGPPGRHRGGHVRPPGEQLAVFERKVEQAWPASAWSAQSIRGATQLKVLAVRQLIQHACAVRCADGGLPRWPGWHRCHDRAATALALHVMLGFGSIAMNICSRCVQVGRVKQRNAAVRPVRRVNAVAGVHSHDVLVAS
jgi:hypothetical protein